MYRVNSRTARAPYRNTVSKPNKNQPNKKDSSIQLVFFPVAYTVERGNTMPVGYIPPHTLWMPRLPSPLQTWPHHCSPGWSGGVQYFEDEFVRRDRRLDAEFVFCDGDRHNSLLRSHTACVCSAVCPARLWVSFLMRRTDL